jgi:hypothetical protein
MPALTAAELTTIRSDYHTVKRYLSIWPRTVIMVAVVTSVSKDSDTNGIYQVGYDTVTLGVYQNALAGRTLDVYTSGGVRRGAIRLRKDATSSVFYVAESAPGEVNVTVGDTVKVIKERRIWRRLPFLQQTNTDTTDFFDTFAVYKDYDLAYTDENEDHRPIANIEGDPAGFLDTGEAYRTVTLTGSNSEAVADSATISSYSWDLDGGAFASGYTSTDADIVGEFPTGNYDVSLTVTDSNGKSSTRYFPVLAHGPGFMPLDKSAFNIDRDDTEYGGGRDLDITIFGNSYEARDDIIPQGTLFCYWETAEFGAQAAPPSQYRNQYLGWAARDATLIRIGFGEYFVTVENAASQLRRIDGSEQFFLLRSSPSEWYEMADITSDREAAHILRYETTALDVCNLYLSGVTDEWGQQSGSNYAAGRVDKAPTWDQLQALAAEYGGVASCDSLNGIYLRRHPSLVEDGGSGRDDIATVIALTANDWTDAGFEYPNEFTPRVGKLEMDGFAFNGSDVSLYQSRAPGKVPAAAPGRETGPAQVLPSTSSQTVLASRAGKRLAWANNPRGEVSLTLWGNFDIIEPAWMEWVTVTATNDNIRGLELSGVRFLVKRVSIQNSNDLAQPAKTITWTLEQETDGETGEANLAPTSDTVDTTGNDYVIPGTDIPRWDGWQLFDGDSLGDNLYADEGAASSPQTVYAADERYIHRTTDFLAVTPTWGTVFDAVSDVGAGYKIIAYEHDNLDPKGTAVVVVSNKSTTAYLYRTTNLSAGSPTWTLKQTWSEDSRHARLFNSIYSGVWMLLLSTFANANFYRTVDDWTTLDTTVTNILGSPPNRGVPGMFISNHAASTDDGLVVNAYCNGANKPQVTVSRDYGQTFAAKTYTFNDYNSPSGIHIPYNGGKSEQVWYVLGGNATGEEAWVEKTEDGGITYDDVSPLYDDLVGDGTLSYGWGTQGELYQRILYSYTKDGDKLALVGTVCNATHPLHKRRLFISDTGGDTWTMQSDFDIIITEKIYAIGGWPYDENILFASGSARLLYTNDRGVTWTDKSPAGYNEGVWVVPIWVT